MRLSAAALLLLVCSALAVFSLPGCDGDDDDDSTTVVVTNAPAGDGAVATGNWTGKFGTDVAFSMTLVQSGDAITGSYSSGGFPGTVNGSVSGNDIELTVSVDTGAPDPVVSEWDGTIDAERDDASGSFTIVSGGGGNGTWEMDR